jgi:hypothetical protein
MKIGDKVRVKSDYPSSNSNTYRRRGQTGKIVSPDFDFSPGITTCVEFDTDHSCNHVYTDALELIDDEFVIPKQWHINVTTKEQAKVVGRWFDQSEFACSQTPNFYERECDLGIYGGASAGNVYGNRVGTEITFEQFEKYILKQNNMKKEIIGYKSPMQIGPKPKGTVYVVTGGTGDLYNARFSTSSIYTVPKEIVETWEPVYKEDQTKTLVLGTSRIKVVISKAKINVDNGNVIEFDSLKKVYDLMVGGNDRRLNIIGTSTDYSVSFPKVKIGCSEFEASEINIIIDAYNELNK